eukprot:GEMP01027366.1.p1 GENE.GEMP01027366.1~~GEMP01027366.1.p1  ORF type:complete len:482 (+),score=90.26 GEMP01027366.1:758-2203(+)
MAGTSIREILDAPRTEDNTERLDAFFMASPSRCLAMTFVEHSMRGLPSNASLRLCAHCVSVFPDLCTEDVICWADGKPALRAVTGITAYFTILAIGRRHTPEAFEALAHRSQLVQRAAVACVPEGVESERRMRELLEWRPSPDSLVFDWRQFVTSLNDGRVRQWSDPPMDLCQLLAPFLDAHTQNEVAKWARTDDPIPKGSHYVAKWAALLRNVHSSAPSDVATKAIECYTGDPRMLRECIPLGERTHKGATAVVYAMQFYPRDADIQREGVAFLRSCDRGIRSCIQEQHIIQELPFARHTIRDFHQVVDSDDQKSMVGFELDDDKMSITEEFWIWRREAPLATPTTSSEASSSYAPFDDKQSEAAEEPDLPDVDLQPVESPVQTDEEPEIEVEPAIIADPVTEPPFPKVVKPEELPWFIDPDTGCGAVPNVAVPWDVNPITGLLGKGPAPPYLTDDVFYPLEPPCLYYACEIVRLGGEGG